jgi:CRISPR-associated protein Csc1
MYVTIGRLTLHENLFYATREVGRLYETGRYLHNYGLTYGLGFVAAPYFNATAVPRYAEDLSGLCERAIYVTPARPQEVQFELNTFKYADNRYRVKMELGSRNTPSFGRTKEMAVGSTFEFAVVSPARIPLPAWVRLGKWMSKAAVAVVHGEEVDLPPEVRPLTYDLISMPPVSLLDHVQLVGPHYKLNDGRCLAAGMAYRLTDNKK